MSFFFNLNNKKANCLLNVANEGRTLLWCSEQTYLYSHFVNIWNHCAKVGLTLRVNWIRWQNQTGELLQKPFAQQPLALVQSTVEYFDLACCHRQAIQRHSRLR